MQRLAGRVVIITGASSGIGAATARLLAAEGARLVLTARRRDRLEALAADLKASGGDCIAVAGDVTRDEDRRRVVTAALQSYDRIDALLNNAGYGQRGPVELVPIDAVRANFETNVFSLLALTQLVLPVMREQGAGRIVNIGSVAGRIARPLSSIYDATKHALEAFSDGLRSEVAPFGVDVVLIQPGYILTEFTAASDRVSRNVVEQDSVYKPFFTGFSGGYRKMRKIAGAPEDIARLVLKALVAGRPRARYAAPRHARLALMLKRCLPERLFDALLRRATGLPARQKRANQSSGP